MSNEKPSREFISEAFQLLQNEICAYLERVDGREAFQEDNWKREEGGGGKTRVIVNGAIIEKGGVNFSEVHGQVTELMKNNTEIKGSEFFATGVSIVLHPHNPHIPIIHMNVRYFETNDGQYWFGGGIDLTPHYIVNSHATLFHQRLLEICNQFDDSFYPKFKKWADDYFFLPHRNETRGIGGIFFDHLNEKNSISKKSMLEFCLKLGREFPKIYEEQVLLGKDRSFSIEELNWRNLRRGRYVEFNLVNDRGTKFGLVSGGRTESILMSLPASAEWVYDYKPSVGSNEANTLVSLKKSIDWLKG